MDAESLAQIEKVVTTAVSGAEGRLRQEIAEKSEESKRHSSEKFEEAERHTDEKFTEAERHSGVLFEEMARRFGLLAEGLDGLRQGQETLRQEMKHESLELQSLVKLSYRQLQERVENLEQRVQVIEKRLDISA